MLLSLSLFSVEILPLTQENDLGHFFTSFYEDIPDPLISPASTISLTPKDIAIAHLGLYHLFPELSQL